MGEQLSDSRMCELASQAALQSAVCALSILLRRSNTSDRVAIDVLADKLIANVDSQEAMPLAVKQEYARQINYLLRGDEPRPPDLKLIKGGKTG